MADARFLTKVGPDSFLARYRKNGPTEIHMEPFANMLPARSSAPPRLLAAATEDA